MRIVVPLVVVLLVVQDLVSCLLEGWVVVVGRLAVYWSLGLLGLLRHGCRLEGLSIIVILLKLRLLRDCTLKHLNFCVIFDWSVLIELTLRVMMLAVILLVAVVELADFGVLRLQAKPLLI
jgi:hypothetical protein